MQVGLGHWKGQQAAQRRQWCQWDPGTKQKVAWRSNQSLGLVLLSPGMGLLGRPNKSPALLMGLLVAVQTPIGRSQLFGDWLSNWGCLNLKDGDFKRCLYRNLEKTETDIWGYCGFLRYYLLVSRHRSTTQRKFPLWDGHLLHF